MKEAIVQKESISALGEVARLETEFDRLHFMCMRGKDRLRHVLQKDVVENLRAYMQSWELVPWFDYIMQEVREVQSALQKDPQLNLKSEVIRILEKWERAGNVAQALCHTEFQSMRYTDVSEHGHVLRSVGMKNINIRDALIRDGFSRLFISE